jgi:hypothetical protein
LVSSWNWLPVTFKRYTGHESDEERRAILADSPDILLTNYVMLELILTRVDERELVKAAKGLRFLVLDEIRGFNIKVQPPANGLLAPIPVWILEARKDGTSFRHVQSRPWTL